MLIKTVCPGSPDSGAQVRLGFDCFTVLAREFVLDENRQKKQIKRKHDRRSLDKVDAIDVESTFVTVEDIH